MSAAVSCNDLEKQNVCWVEDEDVDNSFSTAGDSTLEKSDASVEQVTTM